MVNFPNPVTNNFRISSSNYLRESLNEVPAVIPPEAPLEVRPDITQRIVSEVLPGVFFSGSCFWKFSQKFLRTFVRMFSGFLAEIIYERPLKKLMRWCFQKLLRRFFHAVLPGFFGSCSGKFFRFFFLEMHVEVLK